jgi:hypothetical protein
MRSENGNTPLGSSLWDAANRLEVGFSAGSHLFGVFLSHATEAHLPARRHASWATAERRFRVSGSATLASWLGDQEDERLITLGPVLALVSLRRGRVFAQLAGPDKRALAESVTRLIQSFPKATSTERQEAMFTFSWQRDDCCVRHMSRMLAVPSWTEIGANYARPTRSGLAPLMRRFKPGRPGQTFVWHGEPGTGKTNALRALAWEWRKWCEMHVVTDPDRLFGSSSNYLLELIGDSAWGGTRPYKLLVLEDAGELLRADSRNFVGQGLSRFLNVCDGLLGQNLKLMLLVTTNEAIRSLHPAVCRPGRCAAEVEFSPLSAAEANRWLGKRGEGRINGHATIADLYAISEGREVEAAVGRVGPSIGFGATLGGGR